MLYYYHYYSAPELISADSSRSPAGREPGESHGRSTRSDTVVEGQRHRCKYYYKNPYTASAALVARHTGNLNVSSTRNTHDDVTRAMETSMSEQLNTHGTLILMLELCCYPRWHDNKTLGGKARLSEVSTVPRMLVNDAVGMSRCACAVESRKGARTVISKGNESRRLEEWTAMNSRFKLASAERGCV